MSRFHHILIHVRSFGTFTVRLGGVKGRKSYGELWSCISITLFSDCVNLGDLLMGAEIDGRVERDAFLAEVRVEWTQMWQDRFDDKDRAESVSVDVYPLVLVSRGEVISASRDAKMPSLRDIVDYWTAKGKAYSPPPSVGGWRKFARKELMKHHSREADPKRLCRRREVETQPMRKGGRGWLHRVR